MRFLDAVIPKPDEVEHCGLVLSYAGSDHELLALIRPLDLKVILGQRSQILLVSVDGVEEVGAG